SPTLRKCELVSENSVRAPSGRKIKDVHLFLLTETSPSRKLFLFQLYSNSLIHSSPISASFRAMTKSHTQKARSKMSLSISFHLFPYIRVRVLQSRSKYLYGRCSS